jgi:hypothetical protein
MVAATYSLIAILCQGARMPKELNRLTSQTNLECIPMRLLPGFSMHIVPPAQMTQIINITLLGTKGSMGGNKNEI